MFFISDTHFNHKNIIKYDNRPFSSIEEMNETIICNWNKVVGKKDIVYHLGDFGFGRIEEILKRLNGKIHLVQGSHDRLNSKEKQLFMSINDIKIIKEVTPNIILCHYAMRVWPHSHHGSWHLHGHSHGKLTPVNNLSLDMSINVWSYTPVSYETIKQILQTKV